MLENIYTTKMSADKRQLKRRLQSVFCKPHRSKCSVFLTATVLVLCMVCTTLAMASADRTGENGTLILNGKTYTIDIKHPENNRYLNTDSYYVPLRKVFELFGCRVNYDVDKSTVPGYMKGVHSFPYYLWDERKELAVDSVTEQIYGATSNANTNMPVIEVVSPTGTSWYCQIASESYSNAWAPPVILMDNTCYIPIRAIVYYLAVNEDIDASILWDDAAHDTVYTGQLTFDKETLTVTISTDM